MRFRWMAGVLLSCLAGCGWLSDSQKFSVYFQPYSAGLDKQALESVHAAASFARAHPLQMVTVDGYAAPPDPKTDADVLSAQRATNVKQVLVGDGVGPQRIKTAANGVINPQPLPSLAVRRVDISFGM